MKIKADCLYCIYELMILFVTKYIYSFRERKFIKFPIMKDKKKLASCKNMLLIL